MLVTNDRESSLTGARSRARLAMLVLALAACSGSVPPHPTRQLQVVERSVGPKVGEACTGACDTGAVCVAGVCREQVAHEICAGSPCVASSDSDCRGSLLCAREGLCVAANRRCVAGSETDCKASKGCVEHGRCKLAKLALPIAETDGPAVEPLVCTLTVIGGYSLPDDLAPQVELLTALARGPMEVALEATRFALASGISELREAVCRGAVADSSKWVRFVLAALADLPDPYTRGACARFAGAAP